MERMTEIRETSAAFLGELLEARIKRAEKSYDRQCQWWEQIFRSQLAGLMEQRPEDTVNLVISCLASSIVTGSNLYQLAWHDQDMYVEALPPCLYYRPEFLFDGIGEDIDSIREFLQKHFIRLTDYEAEEMRRHYMMKLYLVAKKFFVRLLPDTSDGNISVWFGEYMKSVSYIGSI